MIYNDLGILNDIVWSVTSGVNPATTTIVIPKVKKEKKFYVGDLKVGDVTIKNLYKLKQIDINADMQKITLIDFRYFFSFPKVYWTKNMLIARGFIFYTSQFFSNSIRQPVWREKTVKINKSNLEAYTAIELIELLFEEVFPDIKLKIDVEINDMFSRPILNFVKFGETFTSVLSQLLDYANLDIQMLNDGSFRVFYRFDSESSFVGNDYFSKLNLLETSEIIQKIPHLQKPKQVFVKVPKVQEIILETKNLNETISDDDYTLLNVTTLNYDLRDTFGNLYYRGMDYSLEQIVTILGSGSFTIGTISVSREGVESFGVNDSFVGKKTFSFSDFCKSVWIPGRLAQLTVENYGVNRGTRKDTVMRGLIAQIQSDFRKKYRIDYNTLKKLFSYSTTVGVPISTDSGTKKPSPVFCDYSAEFKFQTTAFQTNDTNPKYENVPVNFNPETYSGVKAPFTFADENQDIGLLTLVTGEDFEYRLQNIRPFKYLTCPTWGNFWLGYPFLGSSIDADFKLYTIISAMVFDDLYVSDAEAEFLTIDIPDGISETVFEVNFSENPAIFSLTEYGVEWLNEETIKEQIETVVKPQVIATFQDNYAGTCEEVGITNKDGKLYETCTSMTYIETTSELKTRYDVGIIRPPKINYSNMSGDAQAHLFKSNIFNYKR